MRTLRFVGLHVGHGLSPSTDLGRVLGVLLAVAGLGTSVSIVVRAIGLVRAAIRRRWTATRR